MLVLRHNFNNADLIFEIGLKNPNDKNTSVVYLMLNSATEGNDNSGNQSHFDVELAKAYLNNLAIAIRTYAVNQQIELQTSELGKADARQLDLVSYGNKLDGKKAALSLKPLTNNRRNIHRKQLLDRQIAENKSAQAMQKLEIEKQRADLKVLTAGEKTNPDNV